MRIVILSIWKVLFGIEDRHVCADRMLVSEKKNCIDYSVHGIQIDRLGLRVSTQKSVLKNMH